MKYERGKSVVYTAIYRADDVTAEILSAAESLDDGWFADHPIDWEEFFDRLDGIPLDDGSMLDVGEALSTPALEAIKDHLRARRRL